MRDLRDMQIDKIELREVRMKLLHPFETSFGVTQERRILLLKVFDSGAVGYGEVTAGEGPFYSSETTETAWHILCDFIIPWTIRSQLDCASDLGAIVAPIRGHNMAKAALESALWDLEARENGIPLWQHLGGVQSSIESGVSIGIQESIDILLEKISTEIAAGYCRIKLKIKPGWDLKVIQEVRAEFPEIKLMGDANSAYSLADAELFKEMDDYDIMMWEQPMHWGDLLDHAELQKKIRTPICLDESIHNVGDARKAASIKACRIINIKLGRVGGYSSAKEIHDLCERQQIPVWCGGMLESGIGRAHNVALSSLPNFSLPGDVSASKRYWEEDLISPAVEISSGGIIRQRNEPGIGFSPRDDFIDSITSRNRTFVR